jgi:polyferredoxin
MSIATATVATSRVYPKKPSGKFHTARVWVAILLVSGLVAAPFIQVNGVPLLLFNVFERKFILFGYPFFPQDFYLFGLAMLIFFVFIILFTMIFGRVWCGWACPQTIFMEMVFRKLEYWIEGDANQQRALDKASWTSEKILKKGSKHLLFLLFSTLIAHLVMAYLVGVEGVQQVVTQSPAKNWAGFVSLVGFAGVFYLVFTKLREQVCTLICPYGRLQSVLLTKESMVVAYDFVRGEPRGRLKKQSGKAVAKEVTKEEHACTGNCGGCTFKHEHLGTAADAVITERPLTLADLVPQGDCIDCKLCVQVCPTGIDIRNGTQLECINCTACMDACDQVMIKIGKPTGLIRLDSYQSIEEKAKWKFTPRIALYTLLLVALIGLQCFLLSRRGEVDVTLMRVPGMLYQQQPGEKISNLYNIQLTNKTFDPMAVTLKLEEGSPGQVKVVGEKIQIAPSNAASVVFFIELPKKAITKSKTPLVIGIYAGNKRLETAKTNFMGPVR